MTKSFYKGVVRWPIVDKRYVRSFVGLLISMIACCLASCSDVPVIKLPVGRHDHVTVRQTALSYSKPSGLTGDGQVYAVWSFEEPQRRLEYLTSESYQAGGLMWVKGASAVNLSKLINYFATFDPFTGVRSDVASILGDPDFRCAYMDLRFDGNEVVYATIWICSPKLRKVAYLRAN